MEIDNSIEENNQNKKNKIKFIFEKKSDTLFKELSFIALLKGSQLKFENLKSRNLINNYKICSMTKFTETELIFNESKDKAKEIINYLLNIEEKNKAMEIIYEALSYDNTSRHILSESINKLFILNAKEEYYNIIKEYRNVICKEDLQNNENYYSNNAFFIAQNEKEMKNYFIQLLNLLIKLYGDNTRKIARKAIKYEKKNGILTILGNNDLKNYKSLQEFSLIYQKLKFTKKYFFNQPIEYDSNPILYFYKIINLIFDIFLHEDNNKHCFNFIEEKLKQIFNLKGFIDIILIKRLTENEFTRELELCIKFFIFAIDSKIISLFDEFEKFFIFKNNDLLNKKYVMDFFFREKCKYVIKIYYDKFILEDEEEKKSITFDFLKYDKSILKKIIKLESFDLIKQEKYSNIFLDQFQNENFFSYEEIQYLKKLLRHIINSKFFEDLTESFSAKNILPNNILRNKKIQDYILNNLIFLPFYQKNFDTQAMTFHHNAQILISGFPYSLAKEYDSWQIYHILELARKIVEIIHEYIHAIKRYLGICTNELISSETLDYNGDRNEAGYLFEQYLFGWDKRNFFCDLWNKNGNKNLKNGYFDIPTSLKILNPDLYDNDISSIRNILYNNFDDKKCQEFNNKKRNIDLENYLNFMGYDSENKINELKNDKSKIFARRDSSNGNMIEYHFKCGNRPKNKY